MKKCFKCGIKKGLSEFYKHPDMPDGHVNKCKECNKKDVRENFKKNRKYYIKYDKDRIRNNFNYMFLHRHSGMLARVQGRSRNHGKIYKVAGMNVCTKEEFMDWCYEKTNLNKFQKIHSSWVKSNYNRSLCPTIDRIDEDGDYVTRNLQWLTLRDNLKKYIKLKRV